MLKNILETFNMKVQIKSTEGNMNSDVKKRTERDWNELRTPRILHRIWDTCRSYLFLGKMALTLARQCTIGNGKICQYQKLYMKKS